MSGVLNDCDALLQGAGVRIVNPKNAAILLSTSAPMFHLDAAGVADVPSITVTAALVGLDGDVAFSAQGATLTGITDKSATVTRANMQGLTAVITATLVSNGVTYSQSCIIATVQDGADGADGGDGTRGAGMYFAAGSTWSDGVADAATPGGNVAGDVVTISNGSSFSLTKKWSGAAWVAMGAVFHGSLFVTGSIHGSALQVGTVEVRKPDGTLLLGVSGTLAAEAAAPGTLNSDLSPTLNAVKVGTINDDPHIESAASAWKVDSGITIGSGAGGNATCSKFFSCVNASDKQAYSARLYPIDPNRTYQLTAMLYAAAGNNRNMYLWVNFIKADGNRVTAADRAAVGDWGGAMDGYLFGSPPPTGNWYKQGGKFGAGVPGRAIPTTARFVEIGVWFQYSGAGNSNVEQCAQDLRLLEVTEAAVAQSAAEAANAAIASISSDNVLSKGEKPDVVARWQVCDSEKASLVPQASSLGVSSVNYEAAHSALSTYLLSIPGGYDTLTVDSTIDGPTFRAKWRTYHDEKQKLINALAAAAATRAAWGNVSGRPSDSDIRNNLVDLSFWRLGGTIPWTLNGLANSTNGQEGNAIFPCAPGGTQYLPGSIAGPKGGADLVWYAQEQRNNNNEGGGWEVAPLSLDPNKTYRFVVPVRRLSGTGQAYWGPGQGKVAILNDVTQHGNPYFVSGAVLTPGKWYLMVGFLFPHWSNGNTNHGAGLYDCSTGELVAAGSNFQFRPDMGEVSHRAYQYYASNGAEQLFGRPMVNLVDGTEPSLREYFEANAMLNSAVLPLINDKLSKTSAADLAAQITVKTGGAILAGTTTNGAYMSPTGFYGVRGGQVKFSIPIDGDPTFAGTLTAPGGTLGELRVVGSIFGGGFVGYAWPTDNTTTGFAINSFGAIWGNYLSGQYLEIRHDGSIRAPGFSLIDKQVTLTNPIIISPRVNTSFSATLPGANYNNVANGTVLNLGTFAPTLSNGVAPYSFQYTFTKEDVGNMYMYGDPSSTTGVGIKASGSNIAIYGYLSVTVTDANGAVARASSSIRVVFGAGAQ